MKYIVNFALLTLMMINLIKFSFVFLTKREFRNDLWSSLGFKDPKIPPRKQGKIRIWIHAVSLGETKAIEPFAQMVKNELPDVEIIKSSVTATGHEESLKRKDVFDRSFYLPIDFSWRARKLVKKIDPDLFILVENDYWPNLLTQLKAHGTKTALINGRISDRSYTRYKLWPRYAKRLFDNFDILCLQSDEYKSRFEDLGVSLDKISVTGNIKFDATNPKKPRLDLYFPQGKRIITIASTHEGEEEMILEALRTMDDSVCLFIAPRHPERFVKVAEILQTRGVSYRKINEKGRGDERVVLVDMMGVLDECFKVSNAAIVGGSFVKHVGGHNIFEPARHGVPVVYGPYMFNQEPLVDVFKKHNVGKQVELEKLKETLESYLIQSRPEEGIEPLIREVAGATERSWEIIKKL